MLAYLLTKIRKDKKVSKHFVATESGFDPGYISHVENHERIPSYNALKKISSALDVPYQQLLYTYGKNISTDLVEDKFLNLVPYNSVVAIDNFDNLIHCPAKFGSSSFAVRLPDDSMEPKFLKGSYAFIEQNSPIFQREAGLFFLNGEFLIRRLFLNKSSYVLKADNTSYKSINISKTDEFFAIGKIIGTTDDF